MSFQPSSIVFGNTDFGTSIAGHISPRSIDSAFRNLPSSLPLYLPSSPSNTLFSTLQTTSRTSSPPRRALLPRRPPPSAASSTSAPSSVMAASRLPPSPALPPTLTSTRSSSTCVRYVSCSLVPSLAFDFARVCYDAPCGCGGTFHHSSTLLSLINSPFLFSAP